MYCIGLSRKMSVFEAKALSPEATFMFGGLPLFLCFMTGMLSSYIISGYLA